MMAVVFIVVPLEGSAYPACCNNIDSVGNIIAVVEMSSRPNVFFFQCLLCVCTRMGLVRLRLGIVKMKVKSGHGGAVCSAVASQLEGSGFNSRRGKL